MADQGQSSKMSAGPLAPLWHRVLETWGINLSPVSCPRCGTRQPRFRKPQNERQMLWGGGTCPACGCEMDKWGKEVSGA